VHRLAVSFGPGQHGDTGELGAVVGCDHVRLTAPIDQRRRAFSSSQESPPDLTHHVIDDVQDPKTATAGD